MLNELTEGQACRLPRWRDTEADIDGWISESPMLGAESLCVRMQEAASAAKVREGWALAGRWEVLFVMRLVKDVQ